MLRYSFFALFCILFATTTLAQDSQLPSVQLRDLNRQTVDTKEFSNNGKPIIISFWATWCAPCKKELNNIADIYPDWQAESGVKLIAISIDDARSSTRVRPYVNAQAWDYEVYLDPNGDFKRAMNVNNVPHTFLIDGEGNIVWQHNGYTPGDEEELFEKVMELVNG
ncbi:TlpA family protein disulfide reductase [Halocola ammonii]